LQIENECEEFVGLACKTYVLHNSLKLSKAKSKGTRPLPNRDLLRVERFKDALFSWRLFAGYNFGFQTRGLNTLAFKTQKKTLNCLYVKRYTNEDFITTVCIDHNDAVL